jgi:hypothetical protein
VQFASAEHFFQQLSKVPLQVTGMSNPQNELRVTVQLEAVSATVK